jgi:hypothetical protein
MTSQNDGHKTPVTAAQGGPSQPTPSTTEVDQAAIAADAHAIFADRARFFTDDFGRICNAEGVAVAIAIVDDPKVPNQPLVFIRGSEYEAAKMLVHVLRVLRDQITKQITP